MRPKIVAQTKKLLLAANDVYAHEEKELEDSLSESLDEIISLSQDESEITAYLDRLSIALENADRQGCVESIAVLRSLFMNVESAYSNLTEVMSDLAIHIRDNSQEK